MTAAESYEFGPIAAGIITRPAAEIRPLLHVITTIPDTGADGQWRAGYILGFAAGISDDDHLTDEVVRARSGLWSATADLPTALARASMLADVYSVKERAAIIRNCGILSGWKDSTGGRVGADECVTCEARVLLNTEGVTCEHGVFCDEDNCQAAVCDGGRECRRDPEFSL